MLVPYSATAGRSRSTFVLCRLDKEHFSDWPGLLPTHGELFFLTTLPQNKTPQTRLESWDVLLISPPPRSVRERGYRRASEEEIARECHSSALRWGDENGHLYRMIQRAPTSIPSEKASSFRKSSDGNSGLSGGSRPRLAGQRSHDAIHLDRRCRAHRGQCKERWTDGHDETRAVPVRATTVHRNRGGILSGRERRR